MRKGFFRKPLAVIIALSMIVTMLSGFATAAFAQENNVKFSVEISSEAKDGSVGTVKGEVYSDYTGKLTVSGTKVNTSNATVTVSMTDVASLGVEGTRTYTRKMSFDSNQDVGMNNVTQLFDKLVGTTVKFTYGASSVDYSVGGETGQYTLTPSSTEAASAAWHAMVNDENFEYGTKDEDSYIVVANGSWLKAGNSVLEFEEDYEGDLKLDNFGNLSALNDNIRDAVALHQTEETLEGVAFNVAAGTEIALGSSFARLKAPIECGIDLQNYEAVETALADLRDAAGSSTTEMMKGLFGILDSVFTAVETQKTVNVVANPIPEPVKDVKFSVEISSDVPGREPGVVKGEVYADYSGQLKVTGDYVNSNNATVTVTMTDVASLGVEGTRTYTRKMTFDSNQNVPMNNVTQLFDKLNGTSVRFTYGDEASVDYAVEGENGLYTLTPSSKEEAAAAWHAVINGDNFEYGTKEEDSYIVIGNGSWLKAGNSVLEFEKDFNENLKLDNFGDLTALNNNIRNAVVLNTTEETLPGVAFYVAKDTEIALGSSYAKLTTPLIFDVGFENYAEVEQCLKDLRDMTGGTTTDMMKSLFLMLDSVFTAVGGQTIDIQADPAVSVSFDANGAEGEMAGFEAVLGSKFVLPENGFTAPQCKAFDGWKVGEETKNAGDEITLDGDTVITAQWKDAHKYGEAKYTWSDDNKKCTAKVVCANDETHIVAETVDAEYKVTTEPTCEGKGEGTYTATFKNELFETQTKKEEIAATGHTPGEEAKENETEVSYSLPAHYDLVVRCTKCKEIISSKTVYEGTSLKEDAQAAADAADKAIREAAAAEGDEAVAKAQAAVEAADAAVEAAKKALEAAKDDEKAEAQSIYDDALIRQLAALGIQKTAKAEAGEDFNNDPDLSDLRDLTFLQLSALYEAVDGNLYIKDTYDAYKAAYETFKKDAFADDLTLEGLRKMRLDVIKAYTALVLRDSIAAAQITGLEDVDYTGEAFTPAPVVKLGDKVLVKDQDYTVSYESNTNAGTATVTVEGINTYIDTAKGTFTIKKAAQKMKIKVKKQTVKLAKVSKKNQILSKKAVRVTKAVGKKTFKRIKGNKKITINKKTGRITVKKGIKKGTYKFKFKVTANGNKNFKKSTRKRTVKIVVK